MFRRPLLSLVALIVIISVFFITYNVYLVDASIENLQFTLDQTAYAQSVEGVKTMRYFMDELVMDELSQKKVDEKRLAELDFSQSLASEAQDFRQLRDVRFIVEKVLIGKELKRNRLLVFLDKVRRWFGKIFRFRRVEVEEIPPELNRVQEALLKRAEKADRRHDFERAERLFKRFIEQNPDYEGLAFVKLDLGYVYLKWNRFEEAERLFRQVAREKRGTDKEQIAKILLGKLKTQRKLLARRDDLRARLEKTEAPEGQQSLSFDLGLLEKKLFLFSDAEASFRRAADLLPDNEQGEKALFLLALTYKSHGRYREGAQVFNQFLTRFPKSDFIVSARYQLADTLERGGLYQDAADAFAEISELFAASPLAGLAQFRAGYNYAYYVKDPIKAAQNFEKLKEKFATDAFSFYSQAELRPKIAYELLVYGFKKFQANRLEEAQLAFREATKYKESEPWAHSALANIFGIKGEIEKGAKEAELGLGLSTDEYSIAAMGNFFEITGNFDKAINWYQKALERDPDYLLVRKNLSRIYELLGDLKKAIEEYEEITERDPESAEGFNNLGRLYWRNREFDKALSSFQKAVTIDPDMFEAHYNMGLFYSARGDKELAIQAFQQVLRIAPEFEVARIKIEALRARQSTVAGTEKS